jgi:peroxiredoxin
VELIRVEPPGAVPAPLRVFAAADRRAATFDASLPMVPIGVRRVAPGQGVLLVHYWAAWEHRSGPQAVALDSLRRALAPGSIEVAIVCFDPYPSVSRYVSRMRLRLPVLLDLQHALSDRLPCPSIPYTYVVDPAGRIAVAQGGEVDWLAPATRAALEALAREPAPPPVPAAAPS